MKFLAAVGVYLVFAALIGLGIVRAVAAEGSLWLLLIGLAAFLFAFTKVGCLHSS